MNSDVYFTTGKVIYLKSFKKHMRIGFGTNGTFATTFFEQCCIIHNWKTNIFEISKEA